MSAPGNEVQEVQTVIKMTVDPSNIGHAVLLAYTDKDTYLLDNLTNMVLSHKKFTHYAPQYSVNEQYLWRHIKPVKK